MATYSDLIKGSLRLLGVVASGESVDAAMQADALLSLNDMLDSWSTEKLTIPSKVREEFDLEADTGSYTMGPSGDFNTTRPIDIESASIEIQDASPYEVPLEILNSSQWAAISNKEVTGIPSKVYFEMTATTITANFWPVPSEEHKAVFYSWKALSAVTSAATTIALPPGYSKALRYNLALEIAPEYGVTPAQAVIIGATESKANIKRNNLKPQFLSCDSMVLGSTGRGFNILTGE